MILIENPSNDPAYNLALEEFLHLHRRPLRDVFMLWRNEPTVVIGRHQNTYDEINREYVEAAGVHVVRRNSGGGAVYHDLGNLNFSFLVDGDERGFDFERFTQPVIRTLRQLGVEAENSGRNDVVIADRKISGNAQYRRRSATSATTGRLLHHGTILFDSNLEHVAKALNQAQSSKFRVQSEENKPLCAPHSALCYAGTPASNTGRAVASIRSRVTNVAEHLPVKITMEEFSDRLTENVIAEYGLQPDTIRDEEREAICKLRDEKYRSWDWNYGGSIATCNSAPPFWTHTGLRKFPWGTLDIRLEVREGKIASCVFYGDFFSPDDPQTFSNQFIGLTFDRTILENALPEREIRRVFPDLEKNALFDMIFP